MTDTDMPHVFRSLLHRTQTMTIERSGLLSRSLSSRRDTGCLVAGLPTVWALLSVTLNKMNVRMLLAVETGLVGSLAATQYKWKCVEHNAVIVAGSRSSYWLFFCYKISELTLWTRSHTDMWNASHISILNVCWKCENTIDDSYSIVVEKDASLLDVPSYILSQWNITQ